VQTNKQKKHNCEIEKKMRGDMVMWEKKEKSQKGLD
jgi:hypothetical protein